MRSDLLRRVRWTNVALALGTLATLATVIAWPLITTPAPSVPAGATRPLVEEPAGETVSRPAGSGAAERGGDRDGVGVPGEKRQPGSKTRGGAGGRSRDGKKRAGAGGERRGGGQERAEKRARRQAEERRGTGGRGRVEERDGTGGRGRAEERDGTGGHGRAEERDGSSGNARAQERASSRGGQEAPAVPAPQAPDRRDGAPKEFGFEGKR